MDFQIIIEAFGYFASLLVVFSLTRTSVKKLWIINAIGGIAFIIYAMITKSYPTALMNLGAVIIDAVQLYRLSHVHISFELVPADKESNYFKWFADKHQTELEALAPNKAYLNADKIFYYVRDNEVAGILAYNAHTQGKADIVLDYVTEKFRDFRIGKFFFGEQSPFCKEAGISEFIAHATNPQHASYLKQIQFKPITGDQWVKSF